VTEVSPGGARALLWTHRLAGAERQTGVGRYVVELANALVADAAGGVGDLRYELCAGPETEPATWLPPGMEVCRLGHHRRLLHLAWALGRRPVVERMTGPVALVHALAPTFPVPSRAPLVVTVHDLFPFEHPSWSGRFEGWANRRALRWAIDHAAHIVTDSDHVRDKLIARHGVAPDRATTAWLGISNRFVEPVPPAVRDAALAALGLTPRAYVLSVGAVTDRKDLPTIVAAMAQLPEPLPLVVAGPMGGGERGLHAAIERHRMADRVRITGFVDDDTLRALVANACALVHPSLDEGFGFTPLEAMAAGTPAVVSASGSLPEIVGDAAVVVREREPERWAEAITRLGDPATSAPLVAAGRERAAEFTWSRTAAVTAAVHRQVARG
jgi:alpha-1,3-rhamnosyl/mannosyltransferase